MPKQISDTIITGTFDNLVFYKMDDKGYVRSKSSLTGKQFKTGKRFANSRKSAERFSLGNRIASQVYTSIPLHQRDYAMFCHLKSKAISLLKEGQSAESVKASLEQLLTLNK